LKGSAINGYTYQDVRATALLSCMPSIKRACHTACDARGSTAALGENNMISYNEFGKLRLNQFIPKTLIDELENWEFENHLWIGEAHGFSEWLCLESEPAILRSIAIDFSEFPNDAASKVLDIVGLSIFEGMQYSEIEKVLGKPYKTFTFVQDRKSYEFKTIGSNPFIVSCTVLNEGGLTYIVVRTPLTDDE
jgi:hypothetical protein